jgi:putative acetyltransferase
LRRWTLPSVEERRPPPSAWRSRKPGRVARREPTVKVTIRTAQLEDLVTIHDVRRDAILGIASNELASSDRQVWADQRSPEFYAARAAAGDVVLALSNGVIVGWGSRSGDCITGLYVRSAFGRIGIGRVLMSRLEADIAKCGYDCARLDASSNAEDFYIKLGYLPVGPPRDDGAVPMNKALSRESA